MFYLNIDTNSKYYQKVINQEINLSVSPRSININNSVSSPLGTEVNLTVYQVKYYLFFRDQSHGKNTVSYC